MEEKIAMVDGHMEDVVDQTRTTSTALFAANDALVCYETGMTEWTKEILIKGQHIPKSKWLNEKILNEGGREYIAKITDNYIKTKKNSPLN